MSSTGSMSREAYLGVGIPFLALCGACVAVRCTMAVYYRRKLGVDDYLSLIGLAFTTAALGMNDVIIRKFTDPMAIFQHMQWLSAMGVAVGVVIAFALWTSKVPILLVYVNIFGIKRWMRWACYTTVVLTGLMFFFSLMPTFLRCRPSNPAMTPEEFQLCVSGTTLTGVITGFIAVFADALIFILPISAIRDLRLPPAKKLALAGVFASGILGIVASIVSLYYKMEANAGKRSETLVTMFCAVVECTIAIMVGCAPSLRSFWTTFITKSAFMTKYNASKGYASNHGSEPRSKQFQNSAGRSNIVVDQDTYILMEAGSENNQSFPGYTAEAYSAAQEGGRY